MAVTDVEHVDVANDNVDNVDDVVDIVDDAVVMLALIFTIASPETQTKYKTITIIIMI